MCSLKGKKTPKEKSACLNPDSVCGASDIRTRITAGPKQASWSSSSRGQNLTSICEAFLGYCKTDSQISVLWQTPLYVLLNNDSPNPILWGRHGLLSLTGEFNGPVCSWISQKHGHHDRHIGYYRQQPGPVARDNSLAGAVTVTVLLVKTTKEIVLGSPLTISAPHALRARLDSHHNKHLSVSHLPSYEALF